MSNSVCLKFNNPLKHAQVIVIFKKILQKEDDEGEQSYKENKRCISWEQLSRVSSNLELSVPHPEEMYTENEFASVQGVYICMNTAFFYSCKISNYLSHTLGS